MIVKIRWCPGGVEHLADPNMDELIQIPNCDPEDIAPDAVATAILRHASDEIYADLVPITIGSAPTPAPRASGAEAPRV